MREKLNGLVFSTISMLGRCLEFVEGCCSCGFVQVDEMRVLGGFYSEFFMLVGSNFNLI